MPESDFPESVNEPDEQQTPLLQGWLMPTLVVGATAVLGFMLLRILGLIPVPANAEGEKTLAAAIVLVGTIVTGSVSLITLVVKTSFDDRTARMARIEARRMARMEQIEANKNRRLAQEAERRNRIDTVVRAVGLLGADGKNATVTQINGVLLALTSLGEYDLAVALVTQLWPKRLVSRQTVSLIVKDAFSKGSTDTQYLVAKLVQDNAEQLPDESRNLLWPLWNLDWPGTALPRCRIALVLAAMRSFVYELTRSNEWLPVSLAVLHGALKDDNPDVKNLAESVLSPYVDGMDDTKWIHTGTTVIKIADVRSALTIPWVAKSEVATRYQRKVAELITRPQT